jgi:hypothetical protein
MQHIMMANEQMKEFFSETEKSRRVVPILTISCRRSHSSIHSKHPTLSFFPTHTLPFFFSPHKHFTMPSLHTIAGLLALTASRVEAHGYVSNPAPRGLTIPGHPMYSIGVQSDGYAFQDCRDGGMIGPITAEWVEGQEITVDVAMTAFHNGWHELRFCEDARGTNECFVLPGHQAIAVNHTDVEGCPAPAPSQSTHRGSCIPSPKESRNDLLPQSASYRFVLPRGITCDHCAMQWWWITSNGVGEHFKSCHDVRIRPSGPTPAPAPTMPPPPTPAPPPTPDTCIELSRLCLFDGSGDPCCSGTVCKGTVNWATCEPM